MSFSQYLTESRTCFLKAETPLEVIGELTDLACRERKDLKRREVFDAVVARERDIGTQITPYLALPHARLANVGSVLVVAGVSREGVLWGGTGQDRVRLVVLVIGDEAQPQAVLEALAAVGSAFRTTDFLEAILAAESPGELYRALTAAGPFRVRKPDAARLMAAKHLYRQACQLTADISSGCLVLMADDDLDVSFADAEPPACKSVLVTCARRKFDASAVSFTHTVVVPMRGLMQRHALDLALLVAISKDMITLDDTLVCLYGSARTVCLDRLAVLNVRDDLRIPLSLRGELESAEIDFQVLLRVVALATELAGEGREGKPVGTAFVLGDYENVHRRCHQLVINPFKGYADEEKNILDPLLVETVKEFSHLDGAFTVRGDGVIMSAGTYIRSEIIGDQLSAGLGARHAAGQAITACTKALSIVLSESTGAVALFKNGRNILTLKRDDS